MNLLRRCDGDVWRSCVFGAGHRLPHLGPRHGQAVVDVDVVGQDQLVLVFLGALAFAGAALDIWLFMPSSPGMTLAGHACAGFALVFLNQFARMEIRP